MAPYPPDGSVTVGTLTTDDGVVTDEAVARSAALALSSSRASRQFVPSTCATTSPVPTVGIPGFVCPRTARRARPTHALSCQASGVRPVSGLACARRTEASFAPLSRPLRLSPRLPHGRRSDSRPPLALRLAVGLAFLAGRSTPRSLSQSGDFAPLSRPLRLSRWVHRPGCPTRSRNRRS